SHRLVAPQRGRRPPWPAAIGGAARWRNAGSWRWQYGILALAVRRGVDHGRVTSAHLRRRAEARGVTTAYRDWQGRRIQVADETLHAVLTALGSAPPLARPRTGASGGRSAMAAPWHPADHPAAPAVPRSRWRLTGQLYSRRSRLSRGHGHPPR